MNKPFDERRKHLRVYRNFILFYHEKGESAKSHEVSQVNNISKGGLSFNTAHPLEQGAVMMIDLKAPFIADSIHLEGLVLECREKIPEMIYEIRLQFQNIPPEMLIGLEKIESYGRFKEG